MLTQSENTPFWQRTLCLCALVASLAAPACSVGSASDLAGSDVNAGGNTTSNNNSSNPNVAAGDSNVPTGTDLPSGPALRFIGRVNGSDNSNSMAWSATAVEYAFNGSSGSFTFGLLSGNANVVVSVDGVPGAPVGVVPGVPIPFSASNYGNHVARVTKITGTRLGDMNYVGVTCDDGGDGEVSTPSRQLLFIGDSITAGYGVNGSGNCVNSVMLEDATATYAAQAAQALGADYQLLAYPGKGVLRNDINDVASNQNAANEAAWLTNPNRPVTMAALWTHYRGTTDSPSYPFPGSYQPDAVVIALGTNDYEYTNTDPNVAVREPLNRTYFVAAMTALVQDVQTRYPNTTVVLCSSPMLIDGYPLSTDLQHSNLKTDLLAVQAQFSSGSVGVLDFATPLASMMTACGGHPNRAEHIAMGSVLQSKLESMLGW